MLYSCIKQSIIDWLKETVMRIVTRVVDWFATPYSLYLLLRDPGIPWKAKLKAGFILAAAAFYILDPVDLIPDITPVLGWLDDLVIVPLFMLVAGKIVPEIDIAGIRQKAHSTTRRLMFWTAALIGGLVLIGISAFGLLIFLVVRAIN
jgi:uncharacterized membrane protein YkvA (DUF1232 family)